jgi:hypothetical protein
MAESTKSIDVSKIRVVAAHMGATAAMSFMPSWAKVFARYDSSNMTYGFESLEDRDAWLKVYREVA